VRKIDLQAELWIGLGSGQTAKNKAVFKSLETQKAAIEADFGGQLGWQELPEGEGCRIRCVIEGGYKSPLNSDLPSTPPSPARWSDLTRPCGRGSPT
jgi:Domain of unknown function (DUF4268)